MGLQPRPASLIKDLRSISVCQISRSDGSPAPSDRIPGYDSLASESTQIFYKNSLQCTIYSVQNKKTPKIWLGSQRSDFSMATQMLINSDPRRDRNEGISNIPFRDGLSVKSQLKLLAIREYADNSRNILGEIREYLSFVESNPEGLTNLQKASEKLGKLSIEADSWRFDYLYEITQGLQLFLLNAGGRIKSRSSRETIDRGLAMLSVLLDRCEDDFRWRLAVADTVDSFNHAANADEFSDFAGLW
jgi:hypothetical protein